MILNQNRENENSNINDCNIKFRKFIDYLSDEQIPTSSSGRFKRKSVREILTKYSNTYATDDEKEQIKKILK